MVRSASPINWCCISRAAAPPYHSLPALNSAQSWESSPLLPFILVSLTKSFWVPSFPRFSMVSFFLSHHCVPGSSGIYLWSPFFFHWNSLTPCPFGLLLRITFLSLRLTSRLDLTLFCLPTIFLNIEFMGQTFFFPVPYNILIRTCLDHLMKIRIPSFGKS